MILKNLCALCIIRVIMVVYTLYLDIIMLLGHCRGGNFNIHIWAWFGYFIHSKIGFYL